MSNHYELSLTEDGKAYQFTTGTGDRYIAYFTEFTLQTPAGEEMMIPSFGFEKQQPSSSGKDRYDARVKATILFIIREFFKKNPHAGVLYLCLNNDERARNRHITFSKWFQELGDAYEKYDSPVSYRTAGLFSSIVVRSMSSKRDNIKDAFYYTVEYWMGQ